MQSPSMLYLDGQSVHRLSLYPRSKTAHAVCSYRLKTIFPPCNRGGNRNFSKVAGPPIQKTSFTVAGPLTMWAQPITVEYQKSDLSLFPSASSDFLCAIYGPRSLPITA